MKILMAKISWKNSIVMVSWATLGCSSLAFSADMIDQREVGASIGSDSLVQRSWSERKMGMGRTSDVSSPLPVMQSRSWSERKMGVGRTNEQFVAPAVTPVQPVVSPIMLQPETKPATVAADVPSVEKNSVPTRSAAMPVEVTPPKVKHVPVETVVVPSATLIATATSDTPASPAVEQTPVEEKTAPVDGKFVSKLRMAPVSYGWSGNFGYNFRNQKVGSSKNTNQFANINLNGSANTFIWQPWFARVRGSLGLGFNKSMVDTGDSSSVTLTGNIGLSLLPSSRYPFEAYFSKNNNNQNAERGISSMYQTTTYGLSQSYRPRGDGPQFSMRYDHTQWNSTGDYQGKEDRLQGGMTYQFANQSVDVNGNISRAARPYSDDTSQSKSLIGRHNYRLSSAATIDTMASVMQATYSQNGLSTATNYAQLSSATFWRPDNKPLTVNGSIRVDALKADSGINSAGDSISKNMNANVGASYEVNRRFRLNANANLNVSNSSSFQTVSTSQSIAANYQPDAITFANTNYTRNISGSFSNQRSSSDSGSQTYSISPSHNLSRSFSLGSGNVNIALSQSGVLTKDSRRDSTANLSHSGSIGWGTAGAKMNTSLRMSASESRVLVGEKSKFQLVNFQATLSDVIDRSSSWNGNFTIQGARQESELSPVTTSVTSSADLSYRHQRLFNIPRLRFTSDLRIIGKASGSSIAATDDTASWENHLDYSIGRSQLRTTVRVAKVNKVKESLFWFSLTRQF